MAKCVVCTHENAKLEAKRRMKLIESADKTHKIKISHQYSSSVERTLGNRRKMLSAKKHPNKFCRAHGTVGCTGRPTLKEVISECDRLIAADIAAAKAKSRSGC